MYKESTQPNLYKPPFGVTSAQETPWIYPLPTKKIIIVTYLHMGVSKNSGTPKWMVYNGKPY